MGDDLSTVTGARGEDSVSVFFFLVLRPLGCVLLPEPAWVLPRLCLLLSVAVQVEVKGGKVDLLFLNDSFL